MAQVLGHLHPHVRLGCSFRFLVSATPGHYIHVQSEPKDRRSLLFLFSTILPSTNKKKSLWKKEKMRKSKRRIQTLGKAAGNTLLAWGGLSVLPLPLKTMEEAHVCAWREPGRAEHQQADLMPNGEEGPTLLAVLGH